MSCRGRVGAVIGVVDVVICGLSITGIIRRKHVGTQGCLARVTGRVVDGARW
jgi:hypothetical protein